MTRDTNVPSLIKKMRAFKGLTQEEFAHELGVTFATVNSWENGRRFPQPYLLKQLLELKKKLNSRQSKK